MADVASTCGHHVQMKLGIRDLVERYLRRKHTKMRTSLLAPMRIRIGDAVEPL